MIDERDLEWKVPLLSALMYALMAIIVIVIFFAAPALAIIIALIVGLRAYYVHMAINRRRKQAMKAYYGSLDAQEKQQCFLQRYDDPASAIFNVLFPFDRLESYRFILLRQEGVELCEFGGTMTDGTKKSYPVSGIGAIKLTDMKILRGLTFTFAGAEGRTEQLHVFSTTTKNFDQLEQFVKLYYGDRISQ